MCWKCYGKNLRWPGPATDWRRVWVPIGWNWVMVMIEHQILITRPEINDKGPSHWVLQKSISTKTEISEANKVFIKRKRETVCVDRNRGKLRGRTPELLSHILMAVWIILLDISSGFPLANHFNLPDSQSIFGIFQDSSMCAHESFSLNGFYQRGLWVQYPIKITLPLTYKEPFFMGGVLTSGMRNMWSGQGPDNSLNCLDSLILKFQSIGDESPIALPSGVGVGHLPPTSIEYKNI